MTQIDLPHPSGLVDALDRLQGIEGVTWVKLGRGDIVRHPLVQKIVNAYEHGAHKREQYVINVPTDPRSVE